MTVRLGDLGGGRFDPITLDVYARPWVGAVVEWDVETALVERLGDGDGRYVERQRLCHGYKPDITITWGLTITVVELKWHVDHRALRQLEHYVGHELSERRQGTIFGILAGTSIADDLPLPGWCAFQPLVVRVGALS